MRLNDSTMAKLKDFLEKAPQFHLGKLPTEKSNPKTADLSEFANTDLKKAVNILKELDLKVIELLLQKTEEIRALQGDIIDVLKNGGRVFLCGCGATGRLSLSLETFWRKLNKSRYKDRIIAFMAGGDTAIIKSIENFEDHPEYAVNQMEELGFSDGDLLLASTEGGETPYVIGAVEHAAEKSKIAPYFLYCNPDDILNDIERSRNVIQNKGIKKMNLYAGPMAIAGSTRMQASTILMSAIGLALLNIGKRKKIETVVKDFYNYLSALDLSFIADIVEEESRIYKDGGYIYYETDKYAITVLTDTTERSPTFSLLPFENQKDLIKKPSLCYLYLPKYKTSHGAWVHLFGREPRPIEWQKFKAVAGFDYLLGFDFTKAIKKYRRRLLPRAKFHTFKISRIRNKLVLRLDRKRHELELTGLDLLFEHLLLKLVLNIHSTLVMGRLGRYQGNVMTWVKPSNYKLIDRSLRYIKLLLEKEGVTTPYSYEQLAERFFCELETLGDNESIVLKTVQACKCGTYSGD
jgi:N-acetylmuramic acid 6-phosphate etherase